MGHVVSQKGSNRPVYTVIMGHCGGDVLFVLMVHNR